MFRLTANGNWFGFQRGDPIEIEHPGYLERLVGKIEYDHRALGIVGKYRTTIFEWKEIKRGLESGLITVKLPDRSDMLKQQFKPRPDLGIESKLELYEAYFEAKGINENEIRQVVKDAYCPDCGRLYSEGGAHGLRVLAPWHEPPEYYCEPDRSIE